MSINLGIGLAIAALVLLAAVLALRNKLKDKAQQAVDTKLYDGLPTPTRVFSNLLAWFIGPHPQGGPSRSVGLPDHPEAIPDGLWRVRLPAATWPNPAFQLHGVSINAGSLGADKEIYAKIRVTVPEGGTLRPVSFNAPDPEPATPPNLPVLLTFGVQRTGDDWTASYNAAEFDRFYWTPGVLQLGPGPQSGIYELRSPLDASAVAINGKGWTDAQSHSQADSPQQFAATLAECEDVFICTGGGSGLEHGIWYDGPAGTEALIDLLDFKIN